jgi:hypothetical protein
MRWIQSHLPAVRLRHLVLEMLVALSLAFLVWLYTHSRAQMSLDHLQIPVQVQLATSQRDLFAMEIEGDAKVTVTFSGPASRVRDLKKKLQRGQIQVNITLTVGDDKINEASLSETVRIEPAHIPVPPGIHVDVEEPSAIRVNLTRMAERILPVRFEYSGDARVSLVKVEPSTVTVRGPQSVLEKAISISTQPYALSVPVEESADPTVRGKVDLLKEMDGRPIFTTPRQVHFRCKVQPKHKVYEISDVPVYFLYPPEFPYRPRFPDDKSGKISLRLVGPASDEKPPVRAFVELTGTNLARGRNLEPVRLQLPKDFTLLHNSAPVIAFFLDEAERGSPPAEPKE